MCQYQGGWGGPVEIAHIYPLSMGNRVEHHLHKMFWDTLRTFWNESRIKEWESSVFEERRTETCRNLLTLAPSVHSYWGKALSALKPLGSPMIRLH